MAARANVAVLGGAGGIGQPLSLLLKANARVGSVRVFDVAHAKGVAADLSHINTPAHVTGHVGDAELPAALKGADVIVIPAGVPRKPGMTRQDLFDTNAGIVKKLSEQIAQHAPKALICIITNPVNSTVAIAAETLKKAGVYDPRRLFGVTLLDITRARTFVSSKKGAEVTGFDVPVIGGHAGVTILPLLSRTSVPLNFTDAELDELTKRIQEGGTEVVNAKAGAGSATLSMAYAGHEFVDALVQGLQGKNPTVCAMVESTVVPGVKYFANPIVLGKNGLEKNLGIGKLSAYEQKRLDAEVIPELKASIAAGEKFVSK